MNEYVRELIFKYKTKGLLINTNLLLVYFIGSYDEKLISRFKRTIAFTEKDFKRIQRLFKFFDKIVVTPNILTEVNSLSNQLPEKIKLSYFEQISQQVIELEEHYLESKNICQLSYFPKFGLTDSGILELVKEEYLVLTDDFRLANYLENQGIDVINFNHIRKF